MLQTKLSNRDIIFMLLDPNHLVQGSFVLCFSIIGKEIIINFEEEQILALVHLRHSVGAFSIQRLIFFGGA